MVFKNYTTGITIRLILIFLAMLALVVIIGEEGRLFSMILLSAGLILLIAELFHKIRRTNRILQSLLDSIRYGDYSKKVEERAKGLGFEGLAGEVQHIVRAIASAEIEKETQYQYLNTILEHIHTAVITLDEGFHPELINPQALNILGLHNTRNPEWGEIEKAAPVFAAAVRTLESPGRQTIRLSDPPSGKQLLLLMNSVRIGGKTVKVVTFQDIEPEIEQKELESWQTISRIMAHEIMNSLTPLSSLTETGIMMLENDGRTRELKELSQQTIENLHTALRTIADRNQALSQFIGNYRQLSRLPLPDRHEIRISDLLDEIRELYGVQLTERGIGLALPAVKESLVVKVDGPQIKQVLINLIKNAIEALEGVTNPAIGISVKRGFNHISIAVTDNGPGIPGDVLEKIFVPFYSSKPGGSGIGLSLSRQIIRNHGGQISLVSEEGAGTTFRLWLPL